MLSRFSHVWLFETPWTVACQAPLSMGFSRQEYWSSLPFPPPGDLPDPGIKHTSTHCPSLLHCRRSLYSLSHLGLGHYKIQSFSSAPCSLGKVFIFSPSPYCWKTYLELPPNWVLMLKCTPRNAKIMCKRKKICQWCRWKWTLEQFPGSGERTQCLHNPNVHTWLLHIFLLKLIWLCSRLQMQWILGST